VVVDPEMPEIMVMAFVKMGDLGSIKMYGTDSPYLRRKIHS
jgi:hypothetical protein